MKRRFKVFISSSYLDMANARLGLLLKTLKLGHIPAGMELFEPGEEKNLDVIEREIASSDIYVVFVGARAGSQVPGEDPPLTYTMKEFGMARRHKRPTIAFLLHQEEYSDERNKITSADVSERTQEQTLQDFRNTVQHRDDGGVRIVGFFSYKDVSKLCGDYADALRKAVDQLAESGAKGGWIESKDYEELKARIVLGESVSNNPFFQRYANRLSAFEKLSQRVLIEGSAKQAIAEYFWEQYMPRIDEKSITHIYFESGSSIAFVSRKFIEYVKEEEWFNEHGLHHRLKLRTNNLLTYLDFLLVEPPWSPIEIQLMPHGFISHDYGATYGALKAARKRSAPDKPMPGLKLADDAISAIRKLENQLGNSFTTGKGLALLTTSGVDFDPKSPFPGPHVGSYYNMLLKRCLFSLPCPKVLFLDERKWGYPFQLGNCHSVCDPDFTWEHLRTETPLAVAVAAKTKEGCNRLCETLKENGFTHLELGDLKSREGGPWPIIASNEPFARRFS